MSEATQPVAVLGGHGSGVLAAFTLGRIEARGGLQRFVGFLNDTVGVGGRIDGREVLGSFADWPKLAAETMFLAPLHKAKLAQARAARIHSLGIPGERWASVVDPDAIVADTVEFGLGLMVAGHAYVMAATRLGRHVALRSGSYVGHDLTLGDFVFVGANAVVAGYCSVGTGAHIAPAAAVREGITIGKWAVVGLGAVVVRDVPDYAVVSGNPARVISRLEPLDDGGAEQAAAGAGG